MKGKALGIIETVGYVPAVEAADVAVKSADVTLTGCQCVGSGLVSVLMHGEVAAVKASVDAGTSAAERLGAVHSTTVIARTAEGLDEILMEEGKQPKSVTGSPSDGGSGSGSAFKANAASRKVSAAFAPSRPAIGKTVDETVGKAGEAKGDVTVIKAESAEKSPEGTSLEDGIVAEATAGEELLLDMAVLKTLKVTKLRSLARTQDGFPIVRSKIKYAKKSELLKAFARYTK